MDALAGLTTVPWYSAILTSVLGILVLYALSGGSARRQHAQLRSMPGPSGLPLLGNVRGLSRSRRHKTLLRWAEAYGTVFKLNILGTPYVVVADPEVAKEVLVDKEAKFPKPHKYCKSMAEMSHPEALPSLMTCPMASANWRATRKCLAFSFTETEVREDFEAVKGKALILVEELAGLGQGVVVDMGDAATRLSLDALGLAKLDYDFEAVETEEEVMMLKLLKECSEEWAVRQRAPWRPWLWWANDEYADGRQKFQILQAFIGTLWDTLRRRGPAPDTMATLSAQLMRLRDPKTAKAVSERALLSELGGLLVAGGVAPGHVLAWALKLLAANQEVQEKLYAELLRTGLVNRPDLLTMDTVGQLPYLDGVVREALRLYPAFGDGILREAGEDVSLAGGKHRVLKGTQIWIYPYAMHRSSKLWANADSMVPERWAPVFGSQSAAGKIVSYDGLTPAPDVSVSAAAIMQGKGPQAKGAKSQGGDRAGTSGEGSKGTLKQADVPELSPAAYMPFGMGQRSCLGQLFAQAQLKAALGILIAFLKFEIAADDSDGHEEQAGLYLMPPFGVPLTVTVRNPGILSAA